MSPRFSRWSALGGFIGLSVVVSALGGAVTATSVGSWYRELAKPEWNPPNWIFGPVWTALYLLMAVAAWRVWRAREEVAEARSVLTGYFVQLGLNCLWSVLFFGLRSPGLALIDIALLGGVLIWIQVRLARLDRVSAGLWAPYVAWVTFAAALNLEIWRLNR
jgi:tryptophan-rich sensory protein